MDMPFTFIETAPELVISFRARSIDCGDLFAVAAPRLDTGLLFMVKTGVSGVYTFKAADGFFLTVTAPFFTTAAAEKRQTRKTPRAAFSMLPPPKVTVRRIYALRL